MDATILSAKRALICLEELGNVHSLQSFIHKFKDFCQSIREIGKELLKETETKRRNKHDQFLLDQVLNSLISIQYRLPMFQRVMQFYLCHMLNRQAKVGKANVIREVSFELDKILSVLRNWNNKTCEPITTDKNQIEAEMFVKTADNILEYLSSDAKWNRLKGRELISDVNDLVRFSTEVAQGVQCDLSSRSLMRYCEEVLQAMSAVQKMSEEKLFDVSTILWKIDNGKLCEKLSEKIQILELNVNIVILEQLIDISAQPTSTIQYIYEAITSDSHYKEDFNDRLQQFYDYMDFVSQVCGFAVAVASDHNCVRRIGVLLKILEDVELEIGAIVTVCSEPSGPEYQMDISIEYFKLIYSMWNRYMIMLRKTVDEMTEFVSFLRITVLKLKSDITHVRQIAQSTELTSVEKSQLKTSSSRFSSHVTRILEMANGACERRDFKKDTSEEIAIKTSIHQLKIARRAMVKTCKSMMMHMDSKENRLQFYKYCSIVLNCTEKVLEAFTARDLSLAPLGDQEEVDRRSNEENPKGKTKSKGCAKKRNITDNEDAPDDKSTEVLQCWINRSQSSASTDHRELTYKEGFEAVSFGLTDILENLSLSREEISDQSDVNIKLTDETTMDDIPDTTLVDTMERLQDLQRIEIKLDEILKSKPSEDINNEKQRRQFTFSFQHETSKK